MNLQLMHGVSRTARHKNDTGEKVVVRTGFADNIICTLNNCDLTCVEPIIINEGVNAH